MEGTGVPGGEPSISMRQDPQFPAQISRLIYFFPAIYREKLASRDLADEEYMFPLSLERDGTRDKIVDQLSKMTSKILEPVLQAQRIQRRSSAV